MRVLVLSLLLLSTAIPAQDSATTAPLSSLLPEATARGPDWRVYGNYEKDGKQHTALYSVPDIVRSPDGMVRVWTQGAAITPVDGPKTAKDKELLRTVAGRIKAGYAPPLNSIEKLDRDQVMVVTLMEEMVNQRRVGPTMVTLNEIDCKNLRSRFLSIQMYKKGNLESSTDLPGEWSYSPPQSNLRNLTTLVCDPRLTAPDNTPVPVELPP